MKTIPSLALGLLGAAVLLPASAQSSVIPGGPAGLRGGASSTAAEAGVRHNF
ncbi:hypothetical protein V4F39_08295 [Aquincola sp. MAHUQ-54]|uniref:Uncharacterized protein n=1 Tax=Aquincola agrisoli TaxID=3119538 RepID=A0AAW9Q4N1_9BURK